MWFWTCPGYQWKDLLTVKRSKKQIQKAHSHPTTSTLNNLWLLLYYCERLHLSSYFQMSTDSRTSEERTWNGIYVYKWTCWKEIDVYLPDACFSLSTLNNWLSMDLKPWWHKSPEPQTISSVFPDHHLATTIIPPSKPYSCYHLVIINITSQKLWPIAPSTASDFWQMHVKF